MRGVEFPKLDDLKLLGNLRPFGLEGFTHPTEWARNEYNDADRQLRCCCLVVVLGDGMDGQLEWFRTFRLFVLSPGSLLVQKILLMVQKRSWRELTWMNVWECPFLANDLHLTVTQLVLAESLSSLVAVQTNPLWFSQLTWILVKKEKGWPHYRPRCNGGEKDLYDYSSNYLLAIYNVLKPS